MERKERSVAESRVETVHTVRPNHLNSAERLFGGILMQWIDEVAGVVAKRHSHRSVTTVSVDNLHFIKGAYKGQMVVLVGKMTHVGRTSMEVRIDTYIEAIDGALDPINCAYFTMVALDSDDKPTPVPGLRLESEEERREWEAGERRREIRKMRKEEGV